MPVLGAPVITLESISHRRSLENLLTEYPQYRKEIFEQLFELMSNSSEHEENILSQSVLRVEILKIVTEDKAAISLLAALARILPSKKDHLAVLLLHLDRFKALVDSPEAVQQLICEFEDHKNGIATLVSNKEVFQKLASNPATIKSLINLFPELPEYKNMIANLIVEPQMLRKQIDNKAQNALDLVATFPHRKRDIATVVLSKEVFIPLAQQGDFSFNHFTAVFSDHKDRIVSLISEPKLLRSLIEQGLHRILDLSCVFAEYPKFMSSLAEQIHKTDTLNYLVHNASDVKDLMGIKSFTTTMPDFKNQLAEKLTQPRRLEELIRSAVDIEILTDALPPQFKKHIAQMALTDSVFDLLLKPPNSWLNPLKRLKHILVALPQNREDVTNHILKRERFNMLTSAPGGIETLIKLLPEYKSKITQQKQAEKMSSQGRNSFFAAATSSTGPNKNSKTFSSEDKAEKKPVEKGHRPR